MRAKKALVYMSVFPSPPASLLSEPVVMPEVAHQTVTKDIIHKALMTQSTSKAPRPDNFIFQSLCIVWG